MSNLLIIAATNNAHKLVEFKEIFSQAAEAQTQVMSLKDAVRIYAGDAVEYGDPEETGKTFAANAYLKAAALYEFLGKGLFFSHSRWLPIEGTFYRRTNFTFSIRSISERHIESCTENKKWRRKTK